MSCYNHLTIEERECLMLSHERGESIRQIAKKLGRAPSTISRELRRNPDPYRAVSAQKNYKRRRKACVRSKVLHNLELHKMVHFLLVYLWWSPEQISNRFREEGTANISTSTIYRALDNGDLQDTLRYYLRIKYHKLGKNKEPSKLCFQKSISLLSANSVPWSKVTLRTGNLDLVNKRTTALRTVPLSLFGTLSHSRMRLYRSTNVTRESVSQLPRIVSPSQWPGSERSAAASGRKDIVFWKQSLLGSLFLPSLWYFIRR